LFPIRKIQDFLGTRITVEMKGDSTLIEGTLKSFDDYMNLHLTDAVGIDTSSERKDIGDIVLRGNNIILLNPVN